MEHTFRKRYIPYVQFHPGLAGRGKTIKIIRSLCDKAERIVSPLRHPLLTIQTWSKRGLDPTTCLKRAKCWEYLLMLDKEYEIEYLPIDLLHLRDEAAANIFGPGEINWTPRGECGISREVPLDQGSVGFVANLPGMNKFLLERGYTQLLV